MSMLMEGLGELLNQINNPNHNDEQKKEQLMKISELKAQTLLKKKEKGKKISLQDLA